MSWIAGPGSRPSSSHRSRRSRWYACTASACRPDRCSASISEPTSRFAQRMGRDQLGQLADHVAMPTQTQRELEPELRGRQPPLVQPGRGGLHHAAGETEQGRTPPQGQPGGQLVDRGGGVAGLDPPTGRRDQFGEHIGIERSLPDADPVAGAVGDDDRAQSPRVGQQPAQRGDRVLHQPPGRVGRVVVQIASMR